MICPSCDEPSEQATPEPSPAAKKVSRKIKVFILTASITVGLVASGLIGYLIWSAPINQMKSKLLGGDVNAAKAIYFEQIKGFAGAEKETLRFLSARAVESATQFDQKTLTYEQAIEQLKQIQLMAIDLGDQPQSEIDFVEALHQSRLTFAVAEAFLAEKDYAQAITCYQQVIESDGDYQTAQTQLVAASKIYRTDVLEQVETLMAEDKLTETVTELEFALTVMKDNPEFVALWETYHKQLDDINRTAALTSADTFWRLGEMQNALDSLRTALLSIPDDAEMTATLANYSKQIIDNTLAAIDAELTRGNDFAAASGIVESALLLVPDESTLINKKWEIKDLEKASDKRVKDLVDLFSDREVAKLTTKLDIMSYRFDMDIAVIVTLGFINITAQSPALEDAEFYYHNGNYGYHDTQDGILLIFYYNSDELVVYTCGKATENISAAELDSIAESVSDATYTGDLYSAVLKFISVTTRALEN